MTDDEGSISVNGVYGELAHNIAMSRWLKEKFVLLFPEIKPGNIQRPYILVGGVAIVEWKGDRM